MKIGFAWLLAAAMTIAFAAAANAAPATGCIGVAGAECGVGADASHGQFHGLLAVRGAPWVFDAAARSGTTPGCGDCTWSLAIACPETPPHNQTRSCPAARGSASCRSGQVLYRVYLSTDTVTDRIEGTVCIGGGDDPIPVGDEAADDVARYLRNATPPDLRITTRPRLATLAGLPTYFAARPATSLAPVRFGGPQITEAITITPLRAVWRWGDGARTPWAVIGRRLTHTYRRGGISRGSVTTRWGATYTVTYAGRTAGPYDADGTLAKQQVFSLPVRTSSPVLVSR
jgi:hypothetical protein